MTIDIQKLEQLIAEEKFTEAKTLLDEFFKADLSPEEKGESYVNFAALYMQLNNQINSQYEQALDNALADLHDVTTEERKELDDIDLRQARSVTGSAD